ncbi:MAG: YkvA family protein [Cyanobacteriota bacterium]|nr:YkvA family protein [Cyanobacteriota bacterium]
MIKIPGHFLYQAFRRGLRHPQIRPWLILGIFTYLISPIDLIPSLLPIVGEVDDLVLLSILGGELLQMWIGDPFPPAASGQTRNESASAPDHPASQQVIDVAAKVVDS